MIESNADGNAIVKADKPRLIVVDDSADWGNFVSEVAEKAGFNARSTTVPGDFAKISEAEPTDVLVLDLFMPEKDGIEMILDMEHLEERPFIILISGQSRTFLESAVMLGQGKGLDIIGALTKPFRLPDLQAMLQKAASLVEQKKKRGNEMRATRPARPLNAKPGGTAGDHDHAATQDYPTPATVAGHTQFCIMLWDTQLTTLNVLNTIPSRLAEAAAGVIASNVETEDTSSWHHALSMHMQAFLDDQAAIREIANSLQLPGAGQSATDSIDRISTIVSEILAEKSTKSASHAGMLANFRELCSENDRLKESLAVLRSAVKKALALAHNASGLAGSGGLSGCGGKESGQAGEIKIGTT
jgi:CheY-like chemotaxis protein